MNTNINVRYIYAHIERTLSIQLSRLKVLCAEWHGFGRGLLVKRVVYLWHYVCIFVCMYMFAEASPRIIGASTVCV